MHEGIIIAANLLGGEFPLMAKKKPQVRRVPRAAEPRMYGDGKPSQVAQQTGGGTPTGATPTGAAPAARTAAPRAAAPGRPANAASRMAGAAPRVPVTVTTDYHYVLKDLRRLGILAATFFVILIGLGLVIR
jgi:hypothetical protein